MHQTRPATIGPFECIKQYNALLPSDRRRMRYVRSERSSEHVSDAVAFMSWCHEHAIRDPLLYIRTRMALAKALVPFTSLASTEIIEAYLERFAPRVLSAKLTAQDPRERQYIRSLALNARAHEIVRRDYVSMKSTHLCLAQPELSGGYHPLSPNCGACAHGAPCAARLNEREGFDVVALRLNRTDLLPREIAALVSESATSAAHPSSASPSQ